MKLNQTKLLVMFIGESYIVVREKVKELNKLLDDELIPLYYNHLCVGFREVNGFKVYSPTYKAFCNFIRQRNSMVNQEFDYMEKQKLIALREEVIRLTIKDKIDKDLKTAIRETVNSII